MATSAPEADKITAIYWRVSPKDEWQEKARYKNIPPISARLRAVDLFNGFMWIPYESSLETQFRSLIIPTEVMVEVNSPIERGRVTSHIVTWRWTSTKTSYGYKEHTEIMPCNNGISCSSHKDYKYTPSTNINSDHYWVTKYQCTLCERKE